MENKVDESEQWKLRGDCSKCRRQPFCRKRCTAFKKDVQSSIRSATSLFMRQKFGSNIAEKMEKWL